MSRERQGRQVGLVLADETGRQKPGPQGQLDAVREYARRQRRLVPKAPTSAEAANLVPSSVGLCNITSRSAKPSVPPKIVLPSISA
jgi:hypothetical protein